MPAESSAPLPLAGRVALITGATRSIGIGQAIVRRLAADGAAVVVHSWSTDEDLAYSGPDADTAPALVREIRAAGGRAVHAREDLADAAAPARLVQAAADEFGRLDVLVANHARGPGQSLEQLTAAEIDLTYAVNVRATLMLVQAFAARHAAGEPGRIVLFTSGQWHGAMPDELPYIASKAALHELTPSLANHLIARGITVNCIDPGPTDTGYASNEAHAAVLAASPGGRWGEPADAARLIAWLVSDEARWVTGQTIASDGGWSTVH